MPERSRNSQSKTTRRGFLKNVGIFGAGMAAMGSGVFAGCNAGENAEVSDQKEPTDSFPHRKLGKTGVDVSLLCIGGHHIGSAGSQEQAVGIIHQALDQGVNFMDNAWDYHGGRSEEWMGEALKDRRDKAFLMTKMCVHGGDAKRGMEQLEESLRRLKTDYLDLWQIHELANNPQVDGYFKEGGAVEALDKAKEQGKIRFTGFTGHRSPDVLAHMLTYGFPFDTCQLPLNCFDATYASSFERTVLPELQKQGIGVIAMKALAGNGRPVRDGVVSADEAIRYVLSLPVASVCVGIDRPEYLKESLSIIRNFKQMSKAEMDDLRKRMAEYAENKRFEYYKVT